MEFQIDFSSYLTQFFELNLHIWYLGSYLNMFLEKLNVFVKKTFFRDEGSIFDQKFSHLLQSDPAARFPFPQIWVKSLTKSTYLGEFLELGEPPHVQNLGRGLGTNFPQSLSVVRDF